MSWMRAQWASDVHSTTMTRLRIGPMACSSWWLLNSPPPPQPPAVRPLSSHRNGRASNPNDRVAIAGPGS
ncbi:hypothetical protein RJ55_01034 [Drechmeria coniospora]|nr:hypothetical protein RJ55_01034 [Drechmeria coniospora]